MATQTQTRPPLTETVQQLAATPTAALLALQIQSLSAAGSMAVDKDIVCADATAGSFIVTLPAQPYLGKPYAVKETSGANSITVDAAGAGTIDGAANLAIAAGKAATFIARAIDPVTGLVTWAVLSQTDGAAGAGLLAANNLSDVANAATARSNIAANSKNIQVGRLNMIAAGAGVLRYVHRGPSLSITSIDSALTAAIDVDATITAAINGTPITGGVVSVTAAGSAAGTLDQALPSAANVLAAGQVLTLTIGGGNTLASFADLAIFGTF